MGAIPRNVILEIIKDNDFKNPTEIYAYFREDKNTEPYIRAILANER